MFPRGKRLARKHFKALGSGKRFSSAHFSVVVPREATGYAVVVSRKTAKLSTARHLLKRRVLAALRGLDLPPSLVVFPKNSAIALTFAEIEAELATLLA